MQFSNTFIRILVPIWTNDWENITYWEESKQKEVLANKFGLSQIQLGILVLVTIPGKFCNFPPLISLEIAFLALKLAENCYLNMNIFFSQKMAIKSLFGAPLSSTNILCLKDYPHNQTK